MRAHKRHVTMQRHDAASHCDVTLPRHDATDGRTDGLTKNDRDGQREILTVRYAREKSSIFCDGGVS